MVSSEHVVSVLVNTIVRLVSAYTCTQVRTCISRGYRPDLSAPVLPPFTTVLYLCQRTFHHMNDPILSMMLSCNSSSSSNEATEDSPQEASAVLMTTVEEKNSEDEQSGLVTDALGVPTNVKHFPVPAIKKSPYWRFFRVLKIPLRTHRKSRTSSSVPSTHLCILCLKSLTEKADTISSTAWKTAACRVQTSANAHHHLTKRHQDHPDLSTLMEKKRKVFNNSLTGISSPQSQMSALTSTTVASRATPINCFQKFTEKSLQLTMARWLIYENKPVNVMYSDLFKSMFTSTIGKNFTPMAPDTFGMYLDREFSIFVDAVAKLLLQAKEELHGLRFLQVVHDMWTSAGNNNILGSCLCFVTSNFHRQIIPAFLVVNNTSHGAQFNADALKAIYQKRFKMNLDECTRFITSDTTAAARCVSNHIDGSEQVDCEMHILNLILLYGIGLRDNVKTHKATGEDGIERKVQQVVTGGGAFARGLHVIHALRKICKYFGTPQRQNRLSNIQNLNHGPLGTPILDGKTRVASCHRLLQSGILHFWTLQRYYESVANSSDDFKDIWEDLNSSDWLLIQEMESIMKDLSRYALGGSQSDSSLPSEILVYRKVAMSILHRRRFCLLPLERHDQGTTLADLERTRVNGRMWRDGHELSVNGQICLERTKHQIQSRFVALEEPKTYVPLYLDPRTVPYANQIIPDTLKEGTLKLFTEMVTHVLKAMSVPHQASGHELGSNHGRESDTQEQRTAGDSGSEEEFDMENNFILKPSSCALSTGPPDSYGGKNPDIVVQSWINHSHQNIEWGKFLKENRQSSKDIDHVVSSTAEEPQKVNFNNLLSRLNNCNPMIWFNQVGATVFPEISILVRVEFAKVDSSAIQERMFSAAAAAMTAKQTKMSDEVHEKRTVLFANKDFMRSVANF